MRTIVHGDGVDDALTRALEKWQNADEIWEAMTWLIARDPTIGTALTESGFTRAYTIVGAESRGWPNLTVVYTYDAHEILITDSLYAPPKYREAGTA